MDNILRFKFVFGLDSGSPVQSVEIHAVDENSAWEKVSKLIPGARDYIKTIDVSEPASKAA